MLIHLAKAEGCTVLKVGEFFVQFGPVAEPHDAIGFSADSPASYDLEAKQRK